MQCEIEREILVPKPIKKYSIDLTIFSSSQHSPQNQFTLTDKQFKKSRKMTYDFTQFSTRAPNPIENDPMFKLMNQMGIIQEMDFENLL